MNLRTVLRQKDPHAEISGTDEGWHQGRSCAGLRGNRSLHWHCAIGSP